MIVFPDLLNSVPIDHRERSRAIDALGHAFVTGDSSGTLSTLLNHWPVGDTHWNMDDFADDLFIDDVISLLVKEWPNPESAPNVRFLKKNLCAPPADEASVGMRQAIQKDLNRASSRKQFIALLRRLTALRQEMDLSPVLGNAGFSRRRIELLQDVRNTIDMAVVPFDGCRSEITRITRWAEAFRNTHGFHMLAAFLDYENHMSTINLQVRVGADGHIRTFKVVNVSENRHNRFHQGLLGRLGTRLQLLLRGYNVSEAGILARWVETIFEELKSDLAAFIELIGHMEFHVASLNFERQCRRAGMHTCLPVFCAGTSKNDENSAECVIDGAFNPLLLDNHRRVIPCDIRIRSVYAKVIVTGPNSGGKTRLLQTVGIVQLMGQSGMRIPADAARLKYASGLFASLSDGNTPHQTEGRLGMELLRIRHLFEKARPGTLVILDELCSGTNPSEGEEIFHLVLTLLNELDCEVFISTHFLRLAHQLQEEKDTLNLLFLNVKLDGDYRPTFTFVEGVAPTSLAQHTAERMGVSRKELQKLIRQKRQRTSTP